MSTRTNGPIGKRQQQALEDLVALPGQEWRAGCFPSGQKSSNGQQDKIYQSLANRGICDQVGDDQYGMGIYKANDSSISTLVKTKK
jgi:hypothetical protein